MQKMVEIRTEETEAFLGRLLEKAREMDRGGQIAGDITISFADPTEMLSILSIERLRLLKLVKDDARQLTTLAEDLRRDVRAVSRDVALLEKAGLLRTSYQRNPGHGRRKIVESVAREYKLVANL